VINGNTMPPPMYAKSNYARGGFGGRSANRSGQKSGDEHKACGPSLYDEAGSCLKVFIGGLGHDVTEESFRAFFEQARSHALSRAAAPPIPSQLPPPRPGGFDQPFHLNAALAPRRPSALSAFPCAVWHAERQRHHA
jgi:hypothetical protein